MARFENLINQFRKIQPKFSRLYTRILNEAGLTQPQYALLLELAQCMPKPMTMTAISQKLYISKPAVTNLADRLEKGGYLKRLDHPKDRRISLLEIQSKGKKIVNQMQGRFLNLILHTVKQFNERERTVVEKFYATLSQSLDEVLCGKKNGKP